MNAPPVDPSSVAASKEPEAKPLFSDESVTIKNHAVIISGKQYNLGEIENVSIDTDNWQAAVALSCLAALAYFYVFHASAILHVFWNPAPVPAYSLFGFLFMVFGAWSSESVKLVFKIPTGYLVVSKGDRGWTKKIKGEIDRARIAAEPRDNSNRPG